METMQNGTSEQKNEDGSSNLLAGLCYLPFFLINIIAIAYVLFLKKGGKYARFHALQSLFLYVPYTVLVTAFFLIFFLPRYFKLMGTFFGTAGASVQAYESLWVETFLISLPFGLLSCVMIFLTIYLAYSAYRGPGIKLPIIGNFAERFS